MEPGQFVKQVFDTLTGEELDAYVCKHRGYGAIQNRPRVEAVARYCAEHWEGDLVEIGCLYGGTTILFAAIAREYNRRVIAVDPWIKLPFYADNLYGIFCGTIEPYRNVVDVVKLSSLTEEAVAYVKSRPLCFAYVDGLHTYEAALSDMHTTAHCAGVIAVDDIIEWNYAPGSNADIRRAFDDGAESLHRTPMSHYLCREGYLTPPHVEVEYA